MIGRSSGCLYGVEFKSGGVKGWRYRGSRGLGVVGVK